MKNKFKKLLAVLLAISVVSGGAAVFAEPDDSVTAETYSETAAEEAAQTDTPAEQEAPSEEASETEETAPEESAQPVESAQPEETAPAETEVPQETVAPSADVVPAKELSTEFRLDIDVTPRKYIISSNAIIELYDMNDNLLGSELRYVGWDTPSVTMTFTVPEYRMGQKFKIKLVDGLRSIWYYGQKAQTGEIIEVETYGYLNENGEYVQNNGASIAANPNFEKEIHLYITNKWYNDLSPRARVVDDVTMVPVKEAAEAIGLTVKSNTEQDSVKCSLENTAIEFWANNEYVAAPDGGKNAPHESMYIEDTFFVPLRTLTEAFECPLEVTDYGEFIDILVGEAPLHQVIRNRIPVNSRGIGSRTNYLIWVSKHEHKVRVYQGQQYHWKQLKEFPCALGAPGTPTITGQFEILERTRWNYNGYYVGPVLRFHNGYALHSTLLYYNGSEYDGRVGVNISHGCVRLHPADINWISSTVPMRTRVYITE